MKPQKPWRRMTLILCSLSLASLSACVPVTGGNNFCDVVSGPIQFPAEVAQVVVAGAREEAVKISAQNAFGARNCGW